MSRWRDTWRGIRWTGFPRDHLSLYLRTGDQGLQLAAVAAGKAQRRPHRRSGRSSFIAKRTGGTSAAADRQTPGHWESDAFGRSGHAVLTLHERHSRLLKPGKAADPIAAAMHDLLAVLPKAWRQTVTFDNGTEFDHLHDLGIQTFFCDTHAPFENDPHVKTDVQAL